VRSTRRRLHEKVHDVGYHPNSDESEVGSLAELVQRLPAPTVVWVAVLSALHALPPMRKVMLLLPSEGRAHRLLSVFVR
jgi:hypothetical protein